VLSLGISGFGLIGCGDLNSTDCFADFPSKKAASHMVAQAKARGLSDTEVIGGHRPSVRVSSPDTGAAAADFRSTVRRLVRQRGGHLEKNTPCLERPPFD